MRTHRYFSQQVLEPGKEVCLDGNAAHHLVRVMRIKPAQSIILFNGDGHDYVAEVVSLGKKQLHLFVHSSSSASPESPLAMTVVQAISRGERMDQTLQKCTELGASAFQPLISERVEVRLKGARLASRLEHWRGVVISACEQSGRAVIPAVHSPLRLADWLDSPASAESTRIALDPGGESTLTATKIASQVALAIGPEGGFTPAETNLMTLRKVTLAQLGGRVLRTETAGPAAVAILQGMAGDFRHHPCR